MKFSMGLLSPKPQPKHLNSWCPWTNGCYLTSNNFRTTAALPVLFENKYFKNKFFIINDYLPTKIVWH